MPPAATLDAVVPRLFPELAVLDADLRDALLEKLKVRWTHSSTALEGNTLTEGETLGVLRYGLTIAGKPLAHHNEVLGHGRAIELLLSWLLEGRSLAGEDLHRLHAAVQTSVETDYFKPVGAWKREANSALALLEGQSWINDTYAAPEAVPGLMARWLEEFQALRASPEVSPLRACVWSHATFVRIHPYADGNGRMARLLANVPVIERGHLPVLIPQDRRLEYFEALAAWQHASGALRPGDELIGDSAALASFETLCEDAWTRSQSMLEEVRALQQARGR